MTNLDRDIRMAEKLGYGVHYGLYKADHPHTKDIEVDVRIADPRKCLNCGAVFYTEIKNKKYCSTHCQKNAGMRRFNQRKKEERK